ncbi:undecaprenyl-diphosphatase [Ketogulonicigenium robustum]|uniref:Undecaprenyl-diphosphatase n=1 Tax=Ketogulonicigenium robustum TaxID=92947 RepID=A0A1W6P1P1_9RHOB|nr:undecaprenyl-diphosphate phosphatase [Ketogulonicigenium robustum]ARO15435.1 undecaprenyl-diphosphatase [Ketogulonicigenium robustum]
MTSDNLFLAAFMGVIEGLTEFLPVSSTGHLLIAGHFLGFESPARVFEVAIQLGAILALVVFYFARLLAVVRRIPTDPAARRFVYSVLVAFLPAVVIGVLAHDLIKRVLFESTATIAIALIVGGVILLWVDRMKITPRYRDAMDLPLPLALKIGLVQCIAMIPGVSRSGATIVGALLMGVEKRAAAEFSFFLSIPTMFGAVAFDLWKSRDALTGAAWTDIIVGFVVTFFVALLVVRWLLDYISRRGYALFAWWRISLGAAVLLALALGSGSA